jgi:hypothetical protein
MASARWRQRLRESCACCDWVTGRSWTRTRTRATPNHPRRREQQLQGTSGCGDEGEREVLKVGLGGSKALACTGPQERRVDALGLSSGVPQADWAHVLFPRFFFRSVGGCCKCKAICRGGWRCGVARTWCTCSWGWLPCTAAAARDISQRRHLQGRN